MSSFWFKDVLYPSVVQVPDQATALTHLQAGVLVLVMPGNKPKSLKFICPCGCGQAISINLMPQVAKAWRISNEPGRGISLWPSVWLDVGCRSHFIIRRNKARLLFGRMPEMAPDEVERWWESPG